MHTYQKEQRSIKDVLEQVSQLFADHADLLKEFTYFLPDAVQEQAKVPNKFSPTDMFFTKPVIDRSGYQEQRENLKHGGKLDQRMSQNLISSLQNARVAILDPNLLPGVDQEQLISFHCEQEWTRQPACQDAVWLRALLRLHEVVLSTHRASFPHAAPRCQSKL